MTWWGDSSGQVELRLHSTVGHRNVDLTWEQQRKSESLRGKGLAGQELQSLTLSAHRQAKSKILQFVQRELVGLQFHLCPRMCLDVALAMEYLHTPGAWVAVLILPLTASAHSSFLRERLGDEPLPME